VNTIAGHLIEGITPRRAAEIVDSSAADAVASVGNPASRARARIDGRGNS